MVVCLLRLKMVKHVAVKNCIQVIYKLVMIIEVVLFFLLCKFACSFVDISFDYFLAALLRPLEYFDILSCLQII